MKLHANYPPPGSPSPQTIGILLENILKNKNLSFKDRYFLQFVGTVIGTKAAHHTSTSSSVVTKKPLSGQSPSGRDSQMTSFWPVLDRFHEQPHTHDQIHFWTLHLRDVLPRHEDPHTSRPQTLSNPHHFTLPHITQSNAKKTLFSHIP